MLRTPISADANRFVAAALDALPGYDAALQLAEQAQRRLNELAPVPEPTEPDPLTSGTITAKWIDGQLKHTAAVAELEARRRVLVDLRQRAQDRASGLVGERLDSILAGLNDELTKLLAEVATIAEELDGAASAEQAIASDCGPAWKRLVELSGDYAELRAGQQLLMVRFDATRLHAAKPADGSGDEHTSDLMLQNLDQLWPSWRTPHHTMFHVDGSQDRLEPWPADDGAELLLWLATSPAKPWIPTRRQLDQLWQRRRQNANPNPRVAKGVSELLNEPMPSGRRIAPTITNISTDDRVLT